MWSKDAELFSAIVGGGSVDKVASLLASGADVNATNEVPSLSPVLRMAMSNEGHACVWIPISNEQDASLATRPAYSQLSVPCRVG
jgi:hypothetical protein